MRAAHCYAADVRRVAIVTKEEAALPTCDIPGCPFILHF